MLMGRKLEIAKTSHPHFFYFHSNRIPYFLGFHRLFLLVLFLLGTIQFKDDDYEIATATTVEETKQLASVVSAVNSGTVRRRLTKPRLKTL
jgi:hypothetical protein